MKIHKNTRKRKTPTNLNINYKNSFLKKVYLQVTLGVLITILAAFFMIKFYLNENTFLIYGYYSLTPYYFFLTAIIGPFLLLPCFNFFILKVRPFSAKIIFLVYFIINGLLLSYSVYTSFFHFIFFTLGTMFLIFAIASIYGLVTNGDLTSYFIFFKIGLILIIITFIVLWFSNLYRFGWFPFTFIIVLLNILAACCSKSLLSFLEHKGITEKEMDKFSTIRAIILYLNFINIFTTIFTVSGRKRIRVEKWNKNS